MQWYYVDLLARKPHFLPRRLVVRRALLYWNGRDSVEPQQWSRSLQHIEKCQRQQPTALLRGRALGSFHYLSFPVLPKPCSASTNGSFLVVANFIHLNSDMTWVSSEVHLIVVFLECPLFPKLKNTFVDVGINIWF